MESTNNSKVRFAYNGIRNPDNKNCLMFPRCLEMSIGDLKKVVGVSKLCKWIVEDLENSHENSDEIPGYRLRYEDFEELIEQHGINYTEVNLKRST